MITWGRKKKAGPPPESAFDRTVLPGVPSAFTGGDTTLGEMRRMSRDMAERDARTPVEQGLAISLLAVLDLFEQTVTERKAN